MRLVGVDTKISWTQSTESINVARRHTRKKKHVWSKAHKHTPSWRLSVKASSYYLSRWVICGLLSSVNICLMQVKSLLDPLIMGVVTKWRVVDKSGHIFRGSVAVPLSLMRLTVSDIMKIESTIVVCVASIVNYFYTKRRLHAPMTHSTPNSRH